MSSRSLTLLAFGAAGNVSLATFLQVTCAEAAPVAPLWVPCDLVPWYLTFSEEVRVGYSGALIPRPPALESNVLDYVFRCRGIPHDAAGWARHNIPVVIGEPVGPACWAAPLARSIVGLDCGRGRSGRSTGPCRGPGPLP